MKDIIEKAKATPKGEGLYTLLRPPIDHGIITETNLTTDDLHLLVEHIEKLEADDEEVQKAIEVVKGFVGIYRPSCGGCEVCGFEGDGSCLSEQSHKIDDALRTLIAAVSGDECTVCGATLLPVAAPQRCEDCRTSE